MAKKRMFSMEIVDTDAFLDMPKTAQILYFSLAMRADDDGFVSNPKKIIRMIGAGEDDYKVLQVKNFVIVFDSGVCVIKHWLIHNTLRKDRYKPTNYTEEFAMLSVKDNKAYTLATNWQPTGNQLATQYRLDKIIYINNEGNNTQDIHNLESQSNFDIFWSTYDKDIGKEECFKLFITLSDDIQIKILDHVKRYVAANPIKIYRKDPIKYLNKKCWNDEIINTQKKSIKKKKESQTETVGSILEKKLNYCGSCNNGFIETTKGVMTQCECRSG